MSPQRNQPKFAGVVMVMVKVLMMMVMMMVVTLLLIIFIQRQPNTTKPNMDTNTKPNTTKPDVSNMSTKSTRTKVEFIGRPLKQLECVKKQSTFQADLSRNHFIPSP